jgi:hypothetical protein
MTTRIHVDITAGWADCRVTLGEHDVAVTASYLTDGIGDLVASTVSLLRGAPESSCVFAEEPGEYRWHLTRVGEDRLRVQVLATRGVAADPSLGDVSVLDAECRMRTFAGQIAAEFRRLERTLEREGYEHAWGHSFPEERVASLERALHA